MLNPKFVGVSENGDMFNRPGGDPFWNLPKRTLDEFSSRILVESPNRCKGAVLKNGTIKILNKVLRRNADTPGNPNPF